MENNLVTKIKRFKPIVTIFLKEKKSILTFLQKFSEICTMTHCGNLNQAKLANQGTIRICVDFVDGHPVDTYYMFNPKTWILCLTKDVTFFNISCSEWDKVVKPVLLI